MQPHTLHRVTKLQINFYFAEIYNTFVNHQLFIYLFSTEGCKVQIAVLRSMQQSWLHFSSSVSSTFLLTWGKKKQKKIFFSYSRFFFFFCLNTERVGRRFFVSFMYLRFLAKFVKICESLFGQLINFLE